MKRYHVDTQIKLEQLRFAIERGAGYRDAAGAPVATYHKIVNGAGVEIGRIPSALFYASFGVPPSTCCGPERLIVGEDGTAALELPETAEVEAQLGQTIGGVPIPRAQDLVTLAPAKGNDKLPPGVMKRLDRLYLNEIPLLDDVPPEAVDNAGATLPQAKRDALLGAIGEIGDVRLRAAMVKRSQGQ